MPTTPPPESASTSRRPPSYSSSTCCTSSVNPPPRLRGGDVGDAGAGLDAAVAAQQLGFEEADLAHDLAVEIALAHPALRPDEAQIDVEAEHALELLAHAVGQLAADNGAARFDQRADLADEFGPRRAQLLHALDLRLQRLDVLLGALGHLAGLRRRRAPEGQGHLRPSRAREAGSERQHRQGRQHLHGNLRLSSPPTASGPEGCGPNGAEFITMQQGCELPARPRRTREPEPMTTTLAPQSRLFAASNFKLDSGVVLPELTLAYETYGTLEGGGRNAVLYTHGYTGSHHAAGRYGAT